MAFPTVAATTESATSTAATTLTVNFTQTTGDLVVVVMTSEALGTISLGDSFTNNTNHSNRFHIASKVLAGSEGGNMVVTWAASSKGAAIAYNIQGYHPVTALYIPVSLTSGLDAGPLDPGIGVQDFMWIAVGGEAAVHEEADDDTWVSTTPTNYSNTVQKTTGTGGAATSNAYIAAARRNLSSDTEDPGAWAFAQACTACTSFVVAVRGTPSDNPVGSMRPYIQLLPH